MKTRSFGIFDVSQTGLGQVALWVRDSPYKTEHFTKDEAVALATQILKAAAKC